MPKIIDGIVIKIVVLILILTFGGIVRFYNLDKRGYLAPDARAYHHSAKKIAEAVNEFSLNIVASSEDRRNNIKSFLYVDRYLNLYAKPTHVLISSIGQLLFPLKNKSGDLFLCAVSGVITIFVVFLISLKFLNTNYSLISAFLLAILPIHVYYSRAMLAQSHQILFISLAIFVYLWRLDNLNSPKEKVLSIFVGLFLGLSFTSHQNSMVFLFWIIIFDLFLLVKKHINKKSFIIMLINICIPIFIYELIFIAIKIYTGESVLLFNSSYFLQNIMAFLSGTEHGGISYEPSNGWVVPIKAFQSFIKLLPMVMLILGYLFFLRQTFHGKSYKYYFLAFIFIMPYITFAIGMYENHFLRLYSYAVPLVPIFITIFVVKVYGRLKMLKNNFGINRMNVPFILSALLLFYISFTFIKEDQKIIALQSPHVKIEQYMVKNSIKRITAKGQWLYLDNVENIPVYNWEQVEHQYKEKGIKYFLVNEFYFLNPKNIGVFEKLKKCKLLIGGMSGLFTYKPVRYEGVSKKVSDFYDAYPQALNYALYDISGYFENNALQ